MADDDLDGQLQQRMAKVVGDFEVRSEKQLTKILGEVRNERVADAEHYTTKLRNFLMIYTAIVTVLFLFVGFVGLRSTWELQKFQTDMKAIANEAASKKKDIDTEAEKAEDELRALRTHVQTLEGQLGSFEVRFANIKLKSALTSTAPIILQTPSTSVGWMTFQGRNFGRVNGELYAYVQLNTTVSGPIKIEPSSIRGWSDTGFSVSLSQSDLALLTRTRSSLEAPLRSGISPLDNALLGQQSATIGQPPPPALFLCFQVMSAAGKASELSSPIPWR